MGDTTSIDDLPTEPSIGTTNNVVIQKTEFPQNQVQQQSLVYSPNVNGSNNGQMQGIPPSMPPQQPSLQPSNVMNELMSGLQRATANGFTGLPSRDIPRSTDNIMNDEQIRPNYIPKQGVDYISQHEFSRLGIDEMNYVKEKNKQESMEHIYEKLQLPILLGILYFLFQLPVTRRYLVKYIPGIFMNDGNFSIVGLLLISTLFAAFCYLFSEGALKLFSISDM